MSKFKTCLLIIMAVAMCFSCAFAVETKTHLDIKGKERDELFAAVAKYDESGKTYNEKIEISIALPNIKTGIER